jgi:hypothetical protein
MAVPAIRRAWARGILALLNVLLVVLAALFLVKPSTQTPLSLPQVGNPLPPGAAACYRIYTEITTPFNAGARGTPLTSCQFVEQVRRTAYTEHLSASSPPTQLRVISPATRRWFDMQCTSGRDYLTCTGGEDAIVYLYTSRP